MLPLERNIKIKSALHDLESCFLAFLLVLYLLISRAQSLLLHFGGSGCQFTLPGIVQNVQIDLLEVQQVVQPAWLSDCFKANAAIIEQIRLIHMVYERLSVTSGLLWRQACVQNRKATTTSTSPSFVLITSLIIPALQNNQVSEYMSCQGVSFLFVVIVYSFFLYRYMVRYIR